MNTTVQTTVPTFVHFQGMIRISKLEINPQTNDFKLLLEVSRKDGHGYKRPQEVSGKMTFELNNWFTNMYPELIKVTDDSERGYHHVESGESTNGFLRFLHRRGMEFKPGIINELVFECESFSENFDDNPMRLSMLKDRNILTLLNVAPKRKVVAFDPITGERSIKYIPRETQRNRYNKVVAKQLDPSQFRRLITEDTEVVNEIVYQG